MNSFLHRNLLALFLTVIASTATATYFGTFYETSFSMSSSGLWIGDPDTWKFVTGLPSALFFFQSFFLYTLSDIKRYVYLLALPFLAALLIDPVHFYFPLLFSVLGTGAGVAFSHALRLGTRHN